jgi:CobQ-like glutamine amidotransferase family enzyme
MPDSDTGPSAQPGPAGRRGEPTRSTVSIALLFPDLLGTYGDGGNALVLERRLAWRGVPAEIITVGAGDPVPDSCDIYLLGGGEDGPQSQAARELGQRGPVHRAVDRGAVLFAVCAGLQIAGVRFVDRDGRALAGLGLLDCETFRTDEPRAVGELLVEPDFDLPLPRLTGFENHGGRTRLGPDARALGQVRAGVGNGGGDSNEGVMSRHLGRGKVLGTYLHGPVLARNPALADLLVGWILDTAPEQLAPIDDHEAHLLRADRFHAVEHGNLDGVGHRSWRDRLLGRN